MFSGLEFEYDCLFWRVVQCLLLLLFLLREVRVANRVTIISVSVQVTNGMQKLERRNGNLVEKMTKGKKTSKLGKRGHLRDCFSKNWMLGPVWVSEGCIYFPKTSKVESAYWQLEYPAGWRRLKALMNPLMNPWSSSQRRTWNVLACSLIWRSSMFTSFWYFALKVSGSRTKTVTGYLTQFEMIAYSYWESPNEFLPSGPSL